MQMMQYCLLLTNNTPMQTTMDVELIARCRYQNAILVYDGVHGEMPIPAIPISSHWCNGCKCIRRSCWWVPTFYLVAS